MSSDNSKPADLEEKLLPKNESMFDCPVCWSEVSEKNKVMFNGNINNKCGHFSCDDCFQQFFKTMIDNNMLNKIQCPEVGCGIKGEDFWV